LRYPFLYLSFAALLAAQPSVVTNRYDNFGTGANLKETILDAGNVNPAGFGKLFSFSVQGSVYAQPLYLPALDIPGKGTHNVVFIATMDDRVYAFDADTSGDPLWQRELGTPIPIVDVTKNNDLNVVGNVGIISTRPATLSTWYRAARRSRAMCSASMLSTCGQARIACHQPSSRRALRVRPTMHSKAISTSMPRPTIRGPRLRLRTARS
jgi:hypothetical protein